MAQPFAVLMTTNQKPEEERYGVSKIDLLLQKTQNDSHNLVLQQQWRSLLATFNQKEKKHKLKHSVDSTQKIIHSNHKEEKK